MASIPCAAYQASHIHAQMRKKKLRTRQKSGDSTCSEDSCQSDVSEGTGEVHGIISGNGMGKNGSNGRITKNGYQSVTSLLERSGVETSNGKGSVSHGILSSLVENPDEPTGNNDPPSLRMFPSFQNRMFMVSKWVGDNLKKLVITPPLEGAASGHMPNGFAGQTEAKNHDDEGKILQSADSGKIQIQGSETKPIPERDQQMMKPHVHPGEKARSTPDVVSAIPSLGSAPGIHVGAQTMESSEKILA